MPVTTKRGVIELLTVIFYKAKGHTIEKELSSNREKTIFINDGTVLSFLQPGDQNDDKIVVSVMDIDEDNVSSIVINYSKFFSTLKLPASEETVARFYSNYQGNPQDTLWGYMFQRLTDVSNVQIDVDNALAQNDNGKWKEFYGKIIIPAFYRFRDSNEVHLTQAEKDEFIKNAAFKVGNREIFPEAAREANQAASSSSASQLQERPSTASSTAEATEQDVRPQKVSTNKSSNLPEELPKFDDEYELKSRLEERLPPRSPFAPIGDRDLHPFGQYPPLKPHLGGPEAPFSGMIPDANHPLFRGPPGSGSAPNRGDHPQGSRYDDPFGRDDFDMVGQGLPGGRGLGGRSTFGGNNPFGRSDGFGGGFI
ncbi:Translation initiation factor IF-2 [Wickerhamomyces ciferrii]|uniref:Translation initiation factor IF-2 n=1 Tax=Wickerhamomyces ciferrii (strain ATCC 14091 / BCRC 22168 / CBS 111 / JCM 3599 / NBRC 0793 / NRRL Y-1031 F-60-10) TaxID=1206466 RepID=K0KYA5_WICCF|nr:Translation initiation factor IF-2 [Wickerhamomyces ciferrii]CCH47057.1 Translation initiation factor IF-2 [Wickerhamomyces ciferrii]